MIGTTLEKYQILDEIGQGGMATVYRARDLRLQRDVALKVLHPHLARQADARSRFHREAHAVARLRHASILEIYDYSGEEAPTSFIVTELVHGESLREHINRRHLAFPEVAEMIALQLLAALQHAHDQGVIHRDVKPENVLIRQDGVIKLADFGIAHLVDGQGMTMTGAVIGSPAHMSPEQIQGGELGPGSDIFSLGTVLYRLVTGQLPFQASNAQALFRRILAAEHQPAQQIAPLVSNRLNRAIERALAPRPEQRFPSAKAMADELLADLSEVGLTDTAAELRAYLGDPAGYEAWLRPQLLETLVHRGEDLLAEGEKGRALSCFNRALCLEPAEPRVLEAVRAIGRDDRWRSIARWAALLALALAVSGGLALADRLGAFSFMTGSPSLPRVEKELRPTPAPAPGSAVGSAIATAHSPSALPAAAPSGSGPTPAGTSEAAASSLPTAAALLSPAAEPTLTMRPDPDPATSPLPPAPPPPPVRRQPPEPPGGRAAVVQPYPPPPPGAVGTGQATLPQRQVELNITTDPWTRLKLDGVPTGSPLQHHKLLLSGGRHRIVLENPSCQPENLDFEVTASTPVTTRLPPIRLKWLPARLKVVGPEGAVVYVERNQKRSMLGDANAVLELNMNEPREQVVVQLMMKDQVVPLLTTTRMVQPAQLTEIKVPRP